MSTINRIVPISLAMLVCVAGQAFAAGGPVKGAKYAGSIGPGYPVSFRVSADGKDVDGLVVAFEETCNGAAGSTPPKFHFNTLKIEGRKFSGSSTDHFGKKESDALKIKGTFDGHKATGTVSSKSFIFSLGTCTENEPFTATKK